MSSLKCLVLRRHGGAPLFNVCFHVVSLKETRRKVCANFSLEKQNSSSKTRMVRGDRKFNIAPPSSQGEGSWNWICNESWWLLKNINGMLIQLNAQTLKSASRCLCYFWLRCCRNEWRGRMIYDLVRKTAKLWRKRQSRVCVCSWHACLSPEAHFTTAKLNWMTTKPLKGPLKWNGFAGI